MDDLEFVGKIKGMKTLKQMIDSSSLIGLVVDPELLLPEPPPHAANKQANVATTI